MLYLYLTIFLITYLVSSISPSIIICKKVKGTDIRDEGSGNAGTTNSIRTMGTLMGIFVFLLDIAKVFVAYLFVYVISRLFGDGLNITIKSIFILASVVGHCYPIYYGLRGGKGIAVLLTSMMIVDYKATLVCLTVAIIVILVSKMVSLGSIVGVLLAIILAIFMNTNFDPLIIIAVNLVVIFRHRENIKRIINGTENKLSFKKK